MKNFDRNNFKNMSTRGKISMINDLVLRNTKLTPEEIKYLTPRNRAAYFENRTRTSDWVEDYEFDEMDDDEKRVHIQYTRNLTPYALKNLSSELQKDFIDSCMKAYKDLTEDEFSFLKTDDVKLYYVESKIKSNRLASFTPKEVSFIDEKHQIKFLNSLLRNGMVPSEEIISQLKPSAFRFFQANKNLNEIRKVIRKVINEDIFRVDNSIKKYEKLLIDSVIEYMEDKFSFNAKIIVKKKQNSSFIGDISLNHNSIYNHKFTVHFNPNQSYKQVIKSLIHELTHVKQVVKKELGATEDYKSITWKGQLLSVKEYSKIMKNINEYKDLPWEKEAEFNTEHIYEDYLNSNYFKNLLGKDSNLDFIIDNI